MKVLFPAKRCCHLQHCRRAPLGPSHVVKRRTENCAGAAVYATPEQCGSPQKLQPRSSCRIFFGDLGPEAFTVGAYDWASGRAFRAASQNQTPVSFAWTLRLASWD